MDVRLLVHIGNVLYLGSYLVKDIFLLRFLTVVAMFVFLPYYLFQGNDPLWEPVVWSFVFTGVNVYQIVKLFLERRPVVISEEENKIYEQSFTTFTLRQFAKLLKFSHRKSFGQSESILEKDAVTDKVMFVIDGDVIVEKEEKVTSELKLGDFIGDISYLTGNPNRFRISAKDQAKIIFWDKESFEKTVNSDPSYKACWQSLISNKLVEKLNLA